MDTHASYSGNQARTTEPLRIGGVSQAVGDSEKAAESLLQTVGRLEQHLESSGTLRPVPPSNASGKEAQPHVSNNSSLATSINATTLRLRSLDARIISLLERFDI